MAEPVTLTRERSALSVFWRRYRGNATAVVGLAMLLLLAVIALIAHVIAPYPFTQVSVDTFAPLGREHLMGTDYLGRDTYSGILLGARTSLAVGFIATVTSAIIGVVIGLFSGFYGGTIDDVLMRVTEFVLITPTFFLVLVVVALVGPSLVNIILVIGLFSWPRIARVTRGQVLSLRELDYVQAAQALGARATRITFRHVLPNALPAIVVIASLQVGQAILTESALSFLGLGDPIAPSWGRMLNDAQKSLHRSLWQAFFPGLAIFLTVLAINWIGDGLNDAFNPRMKLR